MVLLLERVVFYEEFIRWLVGNADKQSLIGTEAYPCPCGTAGHRCEENGHRESQAGILRDDREFRGAVIVKLVQNSGAIRTEPNCNSVRRGRTEPRFGLDP